MVSAGRVACSRARVEVASARHIGARAEFEAEEPPELDRQHPRRLTGDGYVLSWRGVTPTEGEVAEYLISAAADGEWTQTLNPGDVRVEKACHCTLVDVRGVAFQLRPEPMLQPDVLTAMSHY
ncbi:hypothetical protein [Nocardia sp. NBC_01377]|uniref:hypothetical protein n=1 Tax=Nocardia sp. NBC_01377 TaxID=2903595 RepID=UPI0038666289